MEERPAFAHPQQESRVDLRSLLRALADFDGDARRPQPGMALPVDLGKWVFDRRDDLRDAGPDQRASAQGGDLPKCAQGSSVT